MASLIPSRSHTAASSRGASIAEDDIEAPMLAGHPASPLRSSGATSIEAASSSSAGVKRTTWRNISRGLKNFVAHNWQRAFILAILIALIILISIKGFSIVPDILQWFVRQKSWMGWLAFIGLYCTVVALYLPGIVLIIGAGYVFGFWRGVLAVWIGGSVGQALAFLLARYLLRDTLAGLLKGKSKRWETVDKAIEMEGWKLLVLLRLSPLVPYNMLNIAMAATKIPFWAFATASCFGIIPECSVFCYFGTLADNISQIASGDAVPHGVSTYVLSGVTILMVVISATWATIIVRRALKRAEAQMRASGEDAAVVGPGSVVDDPGRPAHDLSGGMQGGDASHDLSLPSQLSRNPSFVPLARSTSGVMSDGGLTMRAHRASSNNSRSVSPIDPELWAARTPQLVALDAKGVPVPKRLD